MTQPDNQRVLLAQAGSTSPLYPFRSHPLGLMYLASSLRKAAPETGIKIIDMKVQPRGPEDTAREAAGFNCGIIGIGGFSVHADIIEETARAARAAMPGATILAGGPHAGSAPHALLSSGLFNAVATGESEQAFIEAVRRTGAGESLEGIPGVIAPGGASQQPSQIPPPDPDAIPFPAWDLIDIEAYARVSSFSIMGQRRYMSLFTSRGCPFKCFYCHNIFGKKFRPRSAANVLSEIRELVSRYGIRDFDILDDVFNFDRARVHEICENILSLGEPLTFAFPNGLRSDKLDDETLRLMRRAGTRYISFAIESASPRLQKSMGKGLAIEKAGRAIRTAARLGIFCNGFFMLGFPSETEEELSSTVNFAARSPLHTAHFLKVTAFCGTRLFDSLPEEKRGLVSSTPDSGKYYDRSFNLSEISNPRFNKLLAAAHRRFYINPLRIARLILAHPFKKNLLRFAAFAVRRIIFSSARG